MSDIHGRQREASRRPRLEEHRIGVADLPTRAATPLAEQAEPDLERDRFALLYEVGKKVLLASSLEDLNQRVLSLVFEYVNAERGVLLLRDPETGELGPRAVRHRKKGALREAEIPVPTSIVREAVDGRIGILTTDAISDPRFEARASVRQAQIRSALCAPLWDDEEVIGAIYLDSRIRSYAFSREDLVLLNAIANQIAIRLKQERLHSELANERIVRANLQRYHSPDVVEAILSGARKPGIPDVGLQEKEVSIFFVDLKNFTPMAESLSPSVVADVLQEYYELVTAVIFARGGTVNDYLGDAVMAIFGAPVEQPDHARRAVDTGLEVIRRLHEAGTSVAASHFDRTVRVAINSGRVVVGSIGSPDRLKYAVIGDAVNLASRLESLADPNTILIGEQTHRLLGDGGPARKDLGLQHLKGRAQPVRAYCIDAGESIGFSKA